MAFALCACTEATAPSARPATSGTALAGGEVEAPSVYATTEAGLWDGRPSLGGVWVAHPGVKSPRRVLIRNTVNGKSISGALFRRERDLPGTRLQVSSDAAEALGMLAGAPVKLSIVALEQAAVPKVMAPKSDAAAPEATAPARATAKTSVTQDPAAKSPAAKRGVPAPAPVTTAITGAKAAVVTPQETTAQPAAGYYVQLGTFNVEQNARQAADALSRAAAEGEVRRHASGAKIYWSVVAGPAKTPADQELLLKKVRGLGYADAYAVRK
ncbi:MAG TPA: SPOR domain-containing protein [Paenirhodobacter sp.]